MSDTSPNRRQLTNRTIGLVLIGLLSGILLTLWFGGLPWTGNRPIEVSRTVQLGSPGNGGVVPAPTPEGPLQYLDVMSMNAVFQAVSQSVTPTVVYIEVESLPGSNLLSPFSQRGGVSQSLGSGVILSDDGYIVTNNHVIEGATRIRVTLNDKREYAARVVGADPTTDLAVIKIESQNDIPVIALGDADLVEVGEWVLAVGNPFRLTSTVTAGIVSATGRSVRVIDNQLAIESFIQTDAAINPGNSGGAVVNLRGELVGIATAIATESGSYEGYGFAIPVDMMERVVKDLIKFGEVRRGYLGVSIQPVDARLARRLGLDAVRGVYLSSVQPGLAGYEGGLRDGDILLSVNGRDMTEPNELQSAIALFAPGDQVPVVIWRDGRSRTFTVTLKGRDDPGYASWLTELNQVPADTFEPQLEDDQVVNLTEWGIGVANLDNRARRRFQVAHGVFIAFVTPNGPFDASGIPRGTVITAINDVPVFNIDSLSDALRFEGNLLVRVARDDGSTAFFEVRRAEAE